MQMKNLLNVFFSSFLFVLVTLLLFEVVCMMCSWLLIVRAMRMTLYVEST